VKVESHQTDEDEDDIDAGYKAFREEGAYLPRGESRGLDNAAPGRKTARTRGPNLDDQTWAGHLVRDPDPTRSVGSFCEGSDDGNGLDPFPALDDEPVEPPRRKRAWRPKRRAPIAFSIPKHLWRSPAYRALSPDERVLLDELSAMARNIGTDDPIVCSADMAAEKCNVSKTTALRLLSGVRRKGFTPS
jgi:hypothetical protein